MRSGPFRLRSLVNHASEPFLGFPRVVLVSALGALFAACIYPIWNLEGRWFVVAVTALALVSISMMFAGRFSNALLILLLFCVPLAGFKTFFFLDDHVTWTNALGLGIIDFLVAGLYFAWLFRILVLRNAPMPRLQAADVWPALVVLSCLLSLPGSSEPRLVVFAFQNLMLHVLVYFYVSRHFKPQHVPWLLAAIGFAILIESALAVVQNQFGILVGLILDKGAGGEFLDSQYKVPGIEDVARGTGTTYDSHSLGLFMAMVAPFALAFMYSGRLPRAARAASGLLLLAALAGLAVSYSRSAWLFGAFALAIGTAVLLHWRERNILPSLVFAGFALLVAGPWLFDKVFSRLIDAPSELLTARFEQFPVALSIWRENFLFGAGAGNYLGAVESHNLDWALDILVHNVPLYIAAELGLFGVVAYYGLVGAAMVRLWRIVRKREEPGSRLALASFLALFAYAGDGMSDPLFREPVPYLFFWIIVGISVALARSPHGAFSQHQQSEGK
jgi:hypothetical protein